MNARTAFVTIASAALLTAALLIPAESASADVATCGSVITTTGATVTLTGDLNCPGRGITVRAENVTIDLNGHTIYGSTSPDPVIDPILGTPAGVTIYNAGNTRVLNGTIKGFWNGISVIRGAATRLSDLQLSRTASDGIVIEEGTNVTLTNLGVTGGGPGAPSTVGIRAHNVSGFTIDGTVVSGWQDSGLRVDTVSEFSFLRSSTHDNASDGLDLTSAGGRVIIDGSTADHNDVGIFIAQSASTATVTVSHTSTNDNAENGLYTLGSTNFTALGVTANDNGGEGIWTDSALNPDFSQAPYVATVQASTANGNGHSGISMSGAGHWRVAGNHVDANGESGFSFWGGQLALSGNVSTGNTLDGYTWYEASSGASIADTATGNSGHGMVVRTAGPYTVTVLNASLTSNHSDGLLVTSGVARLSGGRFSSNGSDGVRATHGEVDAQRITAIKNRLDGIGFLPGTTGTVDKVNSSQNGRYGICIAKGLAVHDVPIHVLLANHVGARGRSCVATTVRG